MAQDKLTPAAAAAIAEFARDHGRYWKRVLRMHWMNASLVDNPVLHGLRNTHGPSWLAKFRLEDVQ